MQNDVILSPVQIFFRNKWVRLFLVVDIILIFALIGVFVWQTTKTSTISFNITPLDSTISINGKNNYSNGQFSITPGTYEITISHDGLESKKLNATIEPKQIFSLSTFLSDKEKTFDFYKLRTNYMSYKKLEEIASSENNITTDHDTSAEQFIQKFQENYSAFSTKLPIDYYESKGYGQTLEILKNITFKAKYDCNNTLCIQALVVGSDSEDYVNKILEEKGFNVEDFEIEYKFY